MTNAELIADVCDADLSTVNEDQRALRRFFTLDDAIWMSEEEES